MAETDNTVESFFAVCSCMYVCVCVCMYVGKSQGRREITKNNRKLRMNYSTSCSIGYERMDGWIGYRICCMIMIMVMDDTKQRAGWRLVKVYVRIIGSHERQFESQEGSQRRRVRSVSGSKRAGNCQQYGEVAGSGSFNGQRRRGLVLNGLPTH